MRKNWFLHPSTIEKNCPVQMINEQNILLDLPNIVRLKSDGYLIKVRKAIDAMEIGIVILHKDGVWFFNYEQPTITSEATEALEKVIYGLISFLGVD